MYQNDPMKVLTGEVRLSYCNLTAPRAAKQGGEPKFSVTILIPKTDNATKADIVENPKNLEIVEMEAAQLPSRLQDVDMAVINGNYAIDAGLSVSDALAVEASDGEAATAYANVLTVKEGREDDPAIQALYAALCSDEVKAYMEETYGGAVVPLFMQQAVSVSLKKQRQLVLS